MYYGPIYSYSGMRVKQERGKRRKSAESDRPNPRMGICRVNLSTKERKSWLGWLAFANARNAESDASSGTTPEMAQDFRRGIVVRGDQWPPRLHRKDSPAHPLKNPEMQPHGLFGWELIVGNAVTTLNSRWLEHPTRNRLSYHGDRKKEHIDVGSR